MSNNPQNNTNFFDLKGLLSTYLSKWYWIVLSVILALSLAIYKLRYATYVYQTQATIKIKTEDDSEGMQRLQAAQEGLFTQNHTDVLDEILTLKSRILIERVVEDLELNIQLFAKGKIRTSEIYKNRPINISFFATDSIIKKVDTSFTIKAISPSEFRVVDEDDSNDNLIFEFGKKINTSFGGMILTPNEQNINLKNQQAVTVRITPMEKIVAGLQSGINISPSHKKSSILILSLRNAVKDKGEDILNTLITKYNEGVIQEKVDNTKRTADFINDRLNAITVELSQFDMTAETVRKTNRLTDLQAQSTLYLESERQTEARLAETETQIQLVNAMAEFLEQNKDYTKTIPTNVGIQDNTFIQNTNRVNELILQRNRILKNSTEKNPTVVNLTDQITELRNSMSTSVKSIKSSNEIRRNALIEEDRKLSGRIYSAPKKERQSRDITRQQNIKESLYFISVRKKEKNQH